MGAGTHFKRMIQSISCGWTEGLLRLWMLISLHAVLAAQENRLERTPSAPSFPRFTVHTIGHQGAKLGQTFIVDMDRDGDLDWIAGSANHATSKIWWWEYQGPDRWIQHFVGLGNTDVGGSAYDINQDGWVDLLSGSRLLLNSGNPRSEAFVGIDVETIPSHDTEFADLNGDGKMDAIANSDKAGLFWYEIPRDPTQQWISHTIATIGEHRVHGGVSPKAVGDMDGDGDNDVVTAQAWYENRDGGGTHWLPHRNIDFGESHRYGVAVRTWIQDMDGDGDQDFVQSEADNPDSRVAWFENDGAGNWTRHLIKDAGDGQDFHSLVVADFDNDGDWDVFSGGGAMGLSKNPACYLWENRAGSGGKAVSGQWREHILVRKPCHEAVGADVDRDGDIDLCFKPWSVGVEHIYLQNRLVTKPDSK